MKVDLHCHTNISDCSFSFEEILELASREKVKHLSITNHDTTNGLDEMVVVGKAYGIEIIPGIEISAYDFNRNRKVHVLGYFIDPGHSALKDLCDPLVVKRHLASYLSVQYLITDGYFISWEQVKKYAEGGTGVFKQHIMHALIENGYTDSIYGDLYKKLFSSGQNGESPGKAFVPLKYVDARLAVKAIIKAGGVPVLAHPGQYNSFEFIPKLVEAGLQGIEVWHPLHGDEKEAKAKLYAEDFNLIMTGGTDFHGFYGEKEVTIGSKSPGIQAVEGLLERRELIMKKELI
ncbi:phosphatase [Bacillus sp. MUM 116]|uniref:PHP domain-containing protein n=1 Tax=Bacillus sp. MUM 116 TaxID=1678002 RepID=UPI0008F5EC14|nr:PHP domain-containing protein [Bacillus sp. MUM 116]OIK15123.1 phosphatase [Bacillus sp. MUM 116]